MINIELIKIILAFPLFILFYYISSYKKYINENHSVFILSAFIILYTISEYILLGNHSIYEWLTILELPTIDNTINNEVLSNDFYTISTINSPKIYFAKFVYLITLGFFEHTSLLFFLKLIIIFFKPLLLFLILINFTEKNKYYLFNNSAFTKSISALFAIGYLSFIHPDIATGWSSFVDYDFINSLNFSIFLGLVAIYLFQKYTLKNFIGIIILCIATFIHPVAGWVNFIMILLLFNNFKKFKDIFLLFTYNKLLILLIVIIIPYIYLILNFPDTEKVSEGILNNIAVTYRHPYHLIISSFFSLITVAWISLPLLAFLYSSYTNNNKGQIYSILIFLITVGLFFIQYFFTEVYFYSVISLQIQPNRIMIHSSFMYIILLFICVNNKSINVDVLKKSMLAPFKLFIILSFTFFAVTGFIIKKEPLQWDLESRKILNYIKEQSVNNKEDVYYSDYHNEWILSFIRAYNKKTIYSDNAFPYNKSKIEEWYILNKKGKQLRAKIESGNLIEMCDINNYIIDFYIYKNENKLLQEYSKKVNYQNNILDINAFKKKCNNIF